MWKQSGRSSALERAQAVLSSHRGRMDTAHHSPRMSQGDAVRAPPAWMSSELQSQLSDSEYSLSPGPGQDHREGATVPKQTSDWASEVPRSLTPLDAGAIRFLKRPSAAAQDQPRERAVPSSLLASQAAALSRLAQIENRFGKSLHTKGSSRAKQTAAQKLAEETRTLPSTGQPSTGQPSTGQPSTGQPQHGQAQHGQAQHGQAQHGQAQALCKEQASGCSWTTLGGV
ncbi:uncharacterized protein LOC110168993 [Boleophthalmus pectinirostris]|uniref:uncharacterized protein LOC110168993 n=1 Tax=Boleophthalmus pectinirostris TaxID=150288 RepID=UPI00243161DC|nr:uncharacterized protein LOC110168993 [Boleophthalmus pectinirostris]